MKQEQREEASLWLSKITDCPGIQVIGCLHTLPDDHEPGGRSDCVLLIPMEMLSKFAIKRFVLGDDRPVWPEDSKERYEEPGELFVRYYRK